MKKVERKEEAPRQLSRTETHDLSMIIKDRAKVLKAHVREKKAEHVADFEKKLAAEYTFDQDEIWEAATRKAAEVVQEAQNKILERCKELGIPAAFAPSLELNWRARGENLMARRRDEIENLISVFMGVETDGDGNEEGARFMESIGVLCPPPHELLRGGIIGTADVNAIVNQSTSPWFFGPRGIVLSRQTPCAFVPSSGALGLFSWRETIGGTPAEPARWMMPKPPDERAESLL